MYTRKRYLLVGGQVPRSTRYYQAKQKEKKKLEAAVQKDISQNSKERCFHGHSPTEIPTLESTTLEVFDAALPESQYPSTLNDGDEQVLMLEESAVEALNVSMPLPNNSSSSTDTDDQVGPKQRPLRKKRKVSKQKLRTASKQLSSSEEICSSSDSCPSPASHHSSPERSQTLEDYVGDSVPECVISECESESEVEKKGFAKKKSDPLCPCSDITVDDVLCMTLALGIRHDFTWEAQVDILEMFATVFKDAKIPTTKEKYIQSLNVEERSDIKYQIFCKDCGIYLGERKEKVKAVTCGNCSKSIKVKSAANSFVTLSIRSQIKKFLKDEKFVNNILNYRFKRESKSGVLNDIYDGEVYKRLSEDGGVLSSQYNFSYTIFTDGVRYGKSNKTIWPIYLSINELPYEERGKYLILAAVYAGAKDPNPLYFLQPSITEANELSETGISWVHEGKFVTSLIIPLCFVADSVARHQMLNFQTFHSYFGCTFCYKVSKRERGGQRYALSEPAPDRTDLSWREDLHEVHRRLHDPKIPEKKKSYRGVRGPCALLKLKYFSINHCVVDYMHAILVGCVKTHLELILEDTRLKMWIGMDNTKDKVGQNHIVKTLDQRIQLIQSNTTIMRELRLVSDFKLWKASEFRSWLLFYFIPCLSGLLKEKYIVHLAMLSKASFLLLQRSITLENIAEANRLFIMYAFYFQKYFGEENMVYNFHLLSHICKCVANFGPIWGHSSFPFESHNRFILQLLKSPFAVAFQIANKFTIYKHFPTLRQELNLNDRVLKFVEKVLDNKKHGKCVLANDNKCYLFGVPEYYRLTEDDKSKMLHCIGHTDFDDCFFYQRLKYCKKRYTTQAYSSDKENNDSCAFLKNGQCVLIKHIINIPSVHKVLLFVQKIVVSKRPVFNHSRFSYDSYHKVTRFSEHYFVRVECLEAPCFSVVGSDASYVSRIPYGCTIE